MIELLTFGLGFWAAFTLILFIILGITLSEAEIPYLGMALFIVAFGVAEFIFKAGILAFIIANPLSTILFLAIYLSLGVLYTALWRWPNWIKDSKNKILRQFDLWQQHGSLVTINETREDFNEFLESSYYKIFTATYNKDRLINWVLMWVFSITWQLIERPIRALRKFIWITLAQIFENISEREARKINKGNK